MATWSNDLPRDPVDAWFARRFPLRGVLRAEIDADLRGRDLLPADVDDKSFLGDLVERAIGLSLCDEPPYRHLLNCLNHHRAATLLRMAGYQAPDAVTGTDLDAWCRSDALPQPHSLFVAAHRLAHLRALLNPRWGGGRIDPDAIARLLQRHPDALHGDVTETRYEWIAFSVLWNSYAAGFQAALHSFGTATADVRLLDGRRWMDFVLGSTVLEVKSGRLDQPSYLDHLIKQMITYALLAHREGYPITYVGFYAVRYQRLLRYRVQQLLDRLAGEQVDLTATASELAEAILRQSPYGTGWHGAA
jgi:hypothetical protein